jgi:hypothetical protein
MLPFLRMVSFPSSSLSILLLLLSTARLPLQLDLHPKQKKEALMLEFDVVELSLFLLP